MHYPGGVPVLVVPPEIYRKGLDVQRERLRKSIRQRLEEPQAGAARPP
jgi:hypothetical protein